MFFLTKELQYNELTEGKETSQVVPLIILHS